MELWEGPEFRHDGPVRGFDPGYERSQSPDSGYASAFLKPPRGRLLWTSPPTRRSTDRRRTERRPGFGSRWGPRQQVRFGLSAAKHTGERATTSHTVRRPVAGAPSHGSEHGCRRVAALSAGCSGGPDHSSNTAVVLIRYQEVSGRVDRQARRPVELCLPGWTAVARET
jgi:hypothetical protein